MTHRTGMQESPVDPADVIEHPPGLPALSLMIDELELAMRTYCGAAWRQLTKTDSQIVRRKFLKNPAVDDFVSTDLPALYLWPERTVGRRRIADSITTTRYRVASLWVMPPALAIQEQERKSFWMRVDEAFNLLVNPEGASIHTTHNVWGVMLKDQIEAWDVVLEDGFIEDLTIGRGVDSKTYPAFVWRWVVELALEYNFDPAPTGPGPGGPGCMQLRINGGMNADIVLQESHLKAP